MTEQQKSRIKLLCVEDDSINSFILTKVLSNEYDLTIVEDGDKCLEEVGQRKYDVILMDINLGRGKMDGVEILSKIRDREEYKMTPVFAVTSYAMPGDESRFLDQGFNSYFSKPIDLEQLKVEIEKLTQ